MNNDNNNKFWHVPNVFCHLIYVPHVNNPSMRSDYKSCDVIEWQRLISNIGIQASFLITLCPKFTLSTRKKEPWWYMFALGRYREIIKRHTRKEPSWWRNATQSGYINMTYLSSHIHANLSSMTSVFKDIGHAKWAALKMTKMICAREHIDQLP